MKKFHLFSLAGLSTAIVLSGCSQTATPVSETLWYNQPAGCWMESLPVGNGREGAMIYGDEFVETLALNETTLWSGAPDSTAQAPFGKEKLAQARQLFFTDRLPEGNRMVTEGLTGHPKSFGTHLPLGDLKIHFLVDSATAQVSNYRRELDMRNAVATTTYTLNKVNFTQTCFASNPDDVIVWNIKGNKDRAVNATLDFELLRNHSISVENGCLIANGDALFDKHGSGGVEYQCRVLVKNDGGSLSEDSASITVRDASELTLYIDIRTNYTSPTFAGYDDYKAKCLHTVSAAAEKSYKDLLTAHTQDFSNLFSRMSISLGKQSDLEKLPTDQRWKRLKEGDRDPSLMATFFQHARYLLLSLSRENSPLPAALQGFFNDNLACNMAWTNDYHLDMNTQQNYWIANVGNIAECNVPLFNYIKDLSIAGAVTAQKAYGCQGWTAHTTANPWGYTDVSGGIAWGLFPLASSWIASHLWTEYEYTLDKEYLAETAYPLLKGNARFLLDFMVKDPENGYLLTGPCISPENSFTYKGHDLCASMMPTCDRVLAYETFNSCIQAATTLGIDPEFVDSLQQAINDLPPILVGKNGGVREWYRDYDESHPNHRHTSHLLALYPYSQINIYDTPELAEASRKTIEMRLATPDWEDTEWSRANMVCFYARLLDAETACNSLYTLLNSLTRENLMSVSPEGIAMAPYDIFILDGNTAGGAAIGEMLVQGYDGKLRLLPALPAEWNEGEVKGICARGGLTIDMKWDDGVISSALIHASHDTNFELLLPDNANYKLKINGTSHFGERNQIALKKGDRLTIKI